MDGGFGEVAEDGLQNYACISVYKERLFSLERQRLRGDLFEVYQIMRGMDSQDLFPWVGISKIRVHSYKMRAAKLKRDVWVRFFLSILGAGCLESA